MRWLISVAVAVVVVPALASPAGQGAANAASPAGATARRTQARVQDRSPTRPAGSARAAAWQRKIDRITAGRSVSVAVRIDGDVLYERDARVKRVPASNEKLLLSLAMYAYLKPTARFTTTASASAITGSTIEGDLFVLGGGDPTVMSSARHAQGFSFPCTRVGRLARRIRAAGITRITGGVRGAIHYFAHDWFAPGWRSNFPAEYVALPSALSFNTNSVGGRHISDPEFRVARALTNKLEKLGVTVDGAPGSGSPPASMSEIASVRSEPLKVLMRYMNRQSSNFFAEMLGKRLGVERYGRPGTIAKGARAIRSWASANGVTIKAHDGSGLSYDNRVSPRGMTRLLDIADEEAWGTILRAGLPTGDQGTLEDRLEGVPVRAKTGTLTDVSALSGWVYLKRVGEWAPFSIISKGMPKSTAADIENRIVRILVRSAR